MPPPDLARLFAPRAVALVGVPGDLSRPGARPLRFLRRHGYRGPVHPVHPRRDEIGGLRAYRRLRDVPAPVDVVWIGVPAARAAEVLRDCGRADVPFAIVLGAGFAETGAGGEAEQARLRGVARQAGVRLVGPNTVGFVNAWDRVALTFSTAAELPVLPTGPVAVLSQSGGLGGCLVNRAADRGLGVGLFVSAGNEADLTLADYLEWLVADGRARAVACVIEQVRAPERFAAAVSAARERGVAVVALKLGGSTTGRRAARSHTGSLVGERAAWRAWARAAGVLEVEALDQLVETAGFLAEGPPLRGHRVAMVTSSGGVAVLMADALEPRGLSFGRLAGDTLDRVAALLPSYATPGNPLDITAGLPEATFGRVLDSVLRDPGVDVVVVPLTMAATDGGAERAGEIVRAGRATPTPLAVCWPSGSLVEPGMRVLREGRVPLFSTVEGCATALGAALAFARARGTAPAPGPVECREAPPAADRVDILPWAGVRALLDPAGIRLADEVVVRSVADATAAAPGLRYPVAVKVLGVAHRTEVDGVRLGITEAGGMIGAVRELLPRGEGCLVQPMVAGIEVLVGALRDPGLGPFVLVAPGGVEAELYGERAMRPAPVGPAEAARMVGECPGLDARLRGHRGAEGADRAALADVIARVSALAAGLGTRLVELDLNPVIVGQRGAVAVDARVVLARD